MRASQWLLGLATASAVIASIASGCGGSSAGGGPADSGVDATNDVAAEAAKEAAAETGPADAPSEACATDADITKLSPPDASLGDSGATAAGCYSCIENNCGTQLAACNADCTCKSEVITFLGCVAAGGSPVTCGTGLATGGGTAGLPLGACVAGPLLGGTGPGCLKECGVSIPEGGLGDGSKGDAGDGGSSDATGQ